MSRITDLHVAKKLIQIESSATDRGFKFDLDLRTVRRLLNTEKCFFTGIVMNNKEGDPYQRTFDRIDNRKGYLIGNVVVCTKEFNNKKANLTIDDIKLLYRGLQKKKLL